MRCKNERAGPVKSNDFCEALNSKVFSACKTFLELSYWLITASHIFVFNFNLSTYYVFMSSCICFSTVSLSDVRCPMSDVSSGVLYGRVT